MKYSEVLPALALAALALATQLSTSCEDRVRMREHVDLDLVKGPAEASSVAARAADAVRDLQVLTYNAFLRPDPVGWGDERACRARRIGASLANRADELDLVVLNETFAGRPVDVLVDALGDRFPYRVLRKPDARFLSTNGGLSILSRFPIREVYSKRFRSCSSWGDCFAAKGLLHAVVELSSELRVNVLATHLDAGDLAGSAETRGRQLGSIRRYLDRHRVGSHWPTLLLGDLNINGIRGTVDHLGPNRPGRSEYQSMLATLSRDCTNCPDGDCLRSCRGRPVDAVRAETEPWAFTRSQSAPLHTMNCRGQTLAPCRSFRRTGGWRDRLRLDYVLRLRTQDPTRGRAEFRSADQLAFRDDTCDTPYLSDHKAVRAELEVEPRSTAGSDRARASTDSPASRDRPPASTARPMEGSPP